LRLQTPLAGLTPPGLRTKARYMNLHTMIRWAVRILKYREKNNFEVLELGLGFDEPGLNNLALNIETQLKEQEVNWDEIETNRLLESLPNLITENQGEEHEHFDEKLVSILKALDLDNFIYLKEIILDAANIGRAKFDEIFGWTSEQSPAINLYSTLLQMIEFVEEKLKNKGFNRRTVASCRKQLKKLGHCELSQAFGHEVIKFLEQQVQKVTKGKTYLSPL